ncbi:preprotein translocase subunit SecY [Candidatus Kaiserbacteria bacterium CG10_big_fil_rev_8_21_14_0_10_49_17]|uniref:Protein translocase subunit SecY n=1 Tax=Candidatus Kaiserbacteria bacterium CG10_big_fil_rev_8_21_14_0_10_49_17 TaxID=1974609 RepID=A0A2M6WEG6_9BACT|nr:MAG: preprotein translocase subunit SecY [Candidatus Kaiserbacteria bacterium CG10_big_fil_rev_8_21_14_0_10_49_17]
MLATFFQKLKHVFTDSALRKRILFVLGALLVFRIFAAIPIPGIDPVQLENFFNNNQFLGLLNIFSGGGLANLSIVMLGVSPYITASIIMQLLTIMSPKLKALYQEEGEAGRKKFSLYSRWLTLPLAFLQAFGFYVILQRQGIILDTSLFTTVTDVIVIAAGSILLMWIGELISEFGIGNGVSLIIFAGIVASLPSAISQLIFSFDVSQIPLYLGFLALTVIVTAGVVFITEAERPIPITYARRVRGMKVYGGVSTYLPLRVNQAGVIPIIFALALLLLPQMVFSFLAQINIDLVASISNSVLGALSNQWVYGAIYFFFVVAFTYFYTAVTFDPETISKNLQRSGAFVPGVRPGGQTSGYLAKILTRITLFGALFLGFIAILPLIMQGITGIATLTIGGTALLIAVSVVLDLVKKVEAQISMREY